MCKKDSGFVKFWKRVWEWIKEKAKNFWAWLKAVFSGIKWISREQWEELTKEIIKSRQATWDQMDTDKDGWITTKDIADWFKEKKELESK